MKINVRLILLLILFSLALTGCNQSTNSPSEIVISSAYIRQPPPGKQVTVAYMEILNHFPSSCHLTGASADFASTLEIHQHLHQNGLMQMRKLDSLELPMDVPVSLAPGGYHLMIFGLTQPLQPEKKYSITLNFSDCQPVTTRAIVKQIANT